MFRISPVKALSRPFSQQTRSRTSTSCPKIVSKGAGRASIVSPRYQKKLASSSSPQISTPFSNARNATKLRSSVLQTSRPFTTSVSQNRAQLRPGQLHTHRASRTVLTQRKANHGHHRYSGLRWATTSPSPALELKTTAGAPQDFMSTDTFFLNRKVLLVGIVGAFTSVCQNQLPQYHEKFQEFKNKGVDQIAVVSVNDHLVLSAFQKSMQIPESSLIMIADYDGALTRSLEMEVDLGVAKLGKRSKRYAMLVDNGKIVDQWVEEKPSDLKVSSAETVLENLE